MPPKVALYESTLAASNHFHIRALVYALLLRQVLVLANRVCECREAVSRVKDRESSNAEDDHHAFKRNEFSFVTHQLAPPTSSKLWDTVDTSDEDAQVCYSNSKHEAAEAGRMEKLQGLGGELIATSVRADSVFDEEVSEEYKDHNLEDDTRDHQVGSSVLCGRAWVAS